MIRRVNATENLAEAAKAKADAVSVKEHNDRNEIQKLKSELGRMKKSEALSTTLTSFAPTVRTVSTRGPPALPARSSRRAANAARRQADLNATASFFSPHFQHEGYDPIHLPSGTGKAHEVSAYRNMPKSGIQEGKFWNEAQNVSDMWSAWDHFTINRFAPGSSVSPYVNNMTILPLPGGTFKNSFALSNVFSFTTGIQSPLGTNPYTVIFYVPSLSSWNGVTGPGAITSRLGGFSATQTNNLSQLYSCSTLTDASLAYSSVQLYGSDFTSFGSGGMVWAGALDLRIVCPAANLTGAVYKGCITWNQLGSQPTLSNLIQNAQYASVGDYEQTMRSSVVEPILIEDITATFATSTNGSTAQGMDNETIMYLVYQSPVQSITTGATTFSLIANQRGNFSYYNKVTDPLAFSLGASWSKPLTEAPSSSHNSLVSHHVLPRMNSVVEKTAEFKELSKAASDMMGHGQAPFACDVSGIAPTSTASSFLGSMNNTTHSFNGKNDRTWVDNVADGSSLVTDLSSLASGLPGLPGKIANGISMVGPAITKFFKGLASHSDSSQRPLLSNGLSNWDFSVSGLQGRAHPHNNAHAPEPMVSKADLLYRLRALQTEYNRLPPMDIQRPWYNAIGDWLQQYREWTEDQAELIPLSSQTAPLPSQPEDVVSLIIPSG